MPSCICCCNEVMRLCVPCDIYICKSCSIAEGHTGIYKCLECQEEKCSKYFNPENNKICFHCNLKKLRLKLKSNSYERLSGELTEKMVDKLCLSVLENYKK